MRKSTDWIDRNSFGKQGTGRRVGKEGSERDTRLSEGSSGTLRGQAKDDIHRWAARTTHTSTTMQATTCLIRITAGASSPTTLPSHCLWSGSAPPNSCGTGASSRRSASPEQGTQFACSTNSSTSGTGCSCRRRRIPNCPGAWKVTRRRTCASD